MLYSRKLTEPCIPAIMEKKIIIKKKKKKMCVKSVRGFGVEDVNFKDFGIKIAFKVITLDDII